MDESERAQKVHELLFAAETAEMADRLRYQVQFADSALKSLMLMNGGAIVGLFTFIGNTAGKHAAITLKGAPLWWAFGSFVLGMVLAMLSNIGAFLSQDFFANATGREREETLIRLRGDNRVWKPPTVFMRAGIAAQFGGIAAAILSLCVFAFGCWCALSAVIAR
ncbi:hypothetical protein [Caulobacter sp.]|uniref:hypothetical protein n=1 Tax=Caulobacter sp. TaxID=78 RepID=UPI003BB1F279